MSEDYDDITNGPISIDRAKHHCERLAVDCGWRATEVEMHIDAQAEIIEVLLDELKLWRSEPAARYAPQEWKKQMKACMAATDATLAMHNNRL